MNDTPYETRRCTCPPPYEHPSGGWQHHWYTTCPLHGPYVRAKLGDTTHDLEFATVDPTPPAPHDVALLQGHHPSTLPPIPPRTVVIASTYNRYTDWCRTQGYRPTDPRLVWVRDLHNVLGLTGYRMHIIDRLPDNIPAEQQTELMAYIEQYVTDQRGSYTQSTAPGPTPKRKPR